MSCNGSRSPQFASLPPSKIYKPTINEYSIVFFLTFSLSFLPPAGEGEVVEEKEWDWHSVNGEKVW